MEMGHISLESRKKSLQRYFESIILHINHDGTILINSRDSLTNISQDCVNKNYHIKPGQFIMHNETKELFMFIGIGQPNADIAEKFPWIIRESKYRPLMIHDQFLTDRFLERYTQV